MVFLRICTISSVELIIGFVLFLLFFNFTEVEKMGHTYREGAESYSHALKRIDREIGKIIAQLQQSNQWENMRFVISTNYSFDPLSRVPFNPNIWIICGSFLWILFLSLFSASCSI